MKYIKRFRDIALDCNDHYEEKTLVEMCKGNMIMEYQAVLKNLDITQFPQLLHKARKIAKSIRPSFEWPKDRKTTPQAMAVSTREKRKRPDEREYESPPSIPCTPKELDILLPT